MKQMCCIVLFLMHPMYAFAITRAGGSAAGIRTSFHGGEQDRFLGIPTVYLFIFIALTPLFCVTIYYLVKYAKRARELSAVRHKIEQAGMVDMLWSPERISERVRTCFSIYWSAWNSADINAMQDVCTPNFLQQSAQCLEALRRANQSDTVLGSHVIATRFVGAHRAVNSTSDYVIVQIDAVATEILVDIKTNETLKMRGVPVTKNWTFRRSGDKWLIDDITPTREGFSKKKRGESLYF